MKKAAKILTIIGMILGVFGILPLIFGIISLKKQNNGEMTLAWKILTLIFVNPLAGIFLLVAKD